MSDHDTGQGWIHPDAPPRVVESAGEALALYDRWKAGTQSDQALGRAITDQLARSLRVLLGEAPS